MDWQAVSAIGEMIGAIAVLVTLVYVAVQIRQNTAAVATATYESVLAGWNDVTMVVASNPELARIAFHGMYSPDTLSENDAIQFSFLMRSVCNQWLKLLRLKQSGALSDADWAVFAGEAPQVLGTPGGRAFREKNQLFADLYMEIDKLAVEEVSEFRLGGVG